MLSCQVTPSVTLFIDFNLKVRSVLLSRNSICLSQFWGGATSLLLLSSLSRSLVILWVVFVWIRGEIRWQLSKKCFSYLRPDRWAFKASSSITKLCVFNICVSNKCWNRWKKFIYNRITGLKPFCRNWFARML